MQLGFVIDHARCIGCHACTVACKAENDVPVGSFRTWVKYTEAGTFPEVKRSFAVLRCNQCTDAPCVTICPVRALEKRPDGIVDVDPDACIGCKACMQGCPYDALYLNESTGTAEKCHFCAHRVERGLAPACAVVCPTEAIIPGDFHDADSVAWKMRAANGLTVRKAEAGTGPNVYYREVDEAGVDPLRTDAGGGYLWAQRLPGIDRDVERYLAGLDGAASRARTTYDVDRRPPWGLKVSAYLFTKSLAAGLFLVLGLGAWPFAAGDAVTSRASAGLSLLALAFLAATTVLLVADLKRPERFLYILRRPNWSSWLTRGSLILMAYGALLTVWAALALSGRTPGAATIPLWVLGAILAALTACYTGWLFGQSRGRVLWLRRGLWLHLVVQALVAGAALSLLIHPLLGLSPTPLRWCLFVALGSHLLLTLLESRLSPERREREFRRAVRLVTHGPFARRHYAAGLAIGVGVALILLLVPAAPLSWSVAGASALVGLYVEEDILVRAGQALPIS